MSNLKLPTMTYANLDKMLGKKASIKLAYATTAERVGSGIDIRQHGNIIAILGADYLYVDNCGYSTTTTATRLRKILDDNMTGYYVRIKQYAMRLYNDSHTEIDPDFRSMSLTRLGTAWSLSYGQMNDGPMVPNRENEELSLFAV